MRRVAHQGGAQGSSSGEFVPSIVPKKERDNSRPEEATPASLSADGDAGEGLRRVPARARARLAELDEGGAEAGEAVSELTGPALGLKLQLASLLVAEDGEGDDALRRGWMWGLAEGLWWDGERAGGGGRWVREGAVAGETWRCWGAHEAPGDGHAALYQGEGPPPDLLHEECRAVRGHGGPGTWREVAMTQHHTNASRKEGRPTMRPRGLALDQGRARDGDCRAGDCFAEVPAPLDAAFS